MSKLVVTLNTTVLAAAATLSVRGVSWTTKWSVIDSLLIVGSFISGVVSYFGVYFGYVRVLNMVYHNTVYPLEVGFIYAINLQYYGVIASVFLLGAVFARMLDARRTATRPARHTQTRSASATARSRSRARPAWLRKRAAG
jgi:hypothetical protein